MEEIIVTIAPDGSVQVAVQGCPGPDCQALSKAIEEALGDVVEDTPTREMTAIRRTHAVQRRHQT